MNELTWAALAACVALVVSLCSIASFYFGRKKAATDDARQDATVSVDIKYIKDTIRDQTKSIDALTTKFDDQNAKREKEYRELLVKFTELETKHKLLKDDVVAMKKEIAMYHHHN